MNILLSHDATSLYISELLTVLCKIKLTANKKLTKTINLYFEIKLTCNVGTLVSALLAISERTHKQITVAIHSRKEHKLK